MRVTRMALAGLAASCLIVAAGPATAQNVVRWVRGDGVLTWDPHGADTLPSFNGYRQVYEALVLHDANYNLVPGLAVAWKLAGLTTWRFELRGGVTFHDGTPLTAEDVVFSIERARGEGSELAWSLPSGITSIEATDAKTIEITTAEPEPFLPRLIRRVSVMSRAWAEQHGVTQATSFERDQGTWAYEHANGTGPFMLESHEPDQRTVLVRNPNWWGLAEFDHNIDRIVWTIMPDAQERVDALFAGEVDLLQNLPASALDQLRATPGIKVTEAPAPRVVFLGMNQARPELLTSDIKGRNPFGERAVRQAIYHAIDVEALRDEVLYGLAQPAGLLVVPGIGGYIEELDQRLPYDPPKARALLDQAGYGEGFAVRLDCPRARFSGEALCGAIAEQLGEVGVRVTVDALPEREWFNRIYNQKTDFYLHNEFTPSFDSLHTLEHFHSTNPQGSDATGYANPAFDALVEELEGVLITYGRDALMEKAWKILLDDVVVVPLFRPTFAWAMREELDVPLGSVDIPTFGKAWLER